MFGYDSYYITVDQTHYMSTFLYKRLTPFSTYNGSLLKICFYNFPFLLINYIS